RPIFGTIAWRRGSTTTAGATAIRQSLLYLLIVSRPGTEAGPSALRRKLLPSTFDFGVHRGIPVDTVLVVRAAEERRPGWTHPYCAEDGDIGAGDIGAVLGNGLPGANAPAGRAA